MILYFGKHIYKNLEWVMLRHPDYIRVLLGCPCNSKSGMNKIHRNISKLMNVFDKKPMLVKCSSSNCDNLAHQIVVFGSKVSESALLCEKCFSQDNHNSPNKSFSTYKGALGHVMNNCYGRINDYETAIRWLAEAKGLPSTFTESDAIEFLKRNEAESQPINLGDFFRDAA